MNDMGRDAHVRLLQLGGVEAWNRWRNENSGIQPDLRSANLSGTNLREANLGRANLEKATLDDSDLSRADLGEAILIGASLRRSILSDADLSDADLSGADLREAVLFKADLHAATLKEAKLNHTNLRQANLQRVDLSQTDIQHINLNGAQLSGANLREADLTDADLRGANLLGANLSDANLESANLMLANLSSATLKGAKLPDANLCQANLTNANLDGATLRGSNLTQAQLIGTSLRTATLADCKVYGISTWDLNLDNAVQISLRITPDSDAEITSDDLEVAQFLYLMLHNDKIRRVIDTITSKVVLILGRFTPERKRVLDVLRQELRQLNYLPVVFDSEKSTKTTTETVNLLAGMARFVIADVTEPRSVAHELASFVPYTPVPVQPLLLKGESTYTMFADLFMHDWMLSVYYYESIDGLINALKDHVIAPAEAKAAELQRKRTRIRTIDGTS